MSASPLPGRVRLVSFVVHDFDRALQSWLAAGVGPWFVIRDLRLDAVYRSRACEVTVSTGMTNIGDMQVEVIAQQDATPSIYTEFLQSGREGFHQLAWWTTDFNAAVRDAEAAGWPIVWSGGGDYGVRFAYAEPPPGAPATIYEISEISDGIGGFYQLIRDAADGWDGSDPIRPLAL